MADVTQERAELGTLAGAIASVGLPLGAVWCCCFYFYIRRLERRLVATHKSRLLELDAPLRGGRANARDGKIRDVTSLAAGRLSLGTDRGG